MLDVQGDMGLILRGYGNTGRLMAGPLAYLVSSRSVSKTEKGAGRKGEGRQCLRNDTWIKSSSGLLSLPLLTNVCAHERTCPNLSSVTDWLKG